MKKSASGHTLPIHAENALAQLGTRISLLRRSRMLTQGDLARRSGISLSTMGAIESGSASVQMGFYLSVLFALDALHGLDRVALLGEDEAAVERLAGELPRRVRGSAANR